ncbi:MAG: hypothetical protein OXN17_13515 [Candidatus Poribacteria bacterium]|nr:hypothetical protein [Candidatus Poribacteria bacterium]
MHDSKLLQVIEENIRFAVGDGAQEYITCVKYIMYWMCVQV